MRECHRTDIAAPATNGTSGNDAGLHQWRLATIAACATALVLLLATQAAPASTVNVILTYPGGQPIDTVEAFDSVTVELWLENLIPTTTALSAYQFEFNGGDFSTGLLYASDWTESNVFAGLNPPWEPVDQTLDTALIDDDVSGVTGSLSPPFVGPALPVQTPVLVGTFAVYVIAPAGEFVDILLGDQSGIDNQDGTLGGAGLGLLGISEIPVIPEPCTLSLVCLGALCSIRRRQSPELQAGGSATPNPELPSRTARCGRVRLAKRSA